MVSYSSWATPFHEKPEGRAVTIITSGGTKFRFGKLGESDEFFKIWEIRKAVDT